MALTTIIAAPVARTRALPAWAKYLAACGTVAAVLPLSLAGIVNLVSCKPCAITPQYGSELHAAIWTQVSCRQTRKASARARRYRAAVIRCRRGRKWP